MAENLSWTGRASVQKDGVFLRRVHPGWCGRGKAALIICDMWDRHWCAGAQRRVAEMAPAVDRLARAMRRMGVLIVHCPSNTMAFYADSPARARILEAPAPDCDPPLRDKVPLMPEREAPLPFDDSDGGCFCAPKCAYSRPYRRENPAIMLDEARDVVGDGFEVYCALKARGVDTVFYCGVHANICVPGRAFGMRQMALHGMRCVLVRDLIDVMYNPAMPPFINHFDAIDRMAEHLEDYWCTSVLSDEFTNGYPFHFREDYRLF